MQFQCSGCCCNLANNCHNRATPTSQLRAYYLKGQRTQLAKHRLSGFAPTPPPFGVQIAFNCSLLPRKRLQLHNPSSFPFLLFWFYTRPLHAITRFNRPCPSYTAHSPNNKGVRRPLPSSHLQKPLLYPKLVLYTPQSSAFFSMVWHSFLACVCAFKKFVALATPL